MIASGCEPFRVWSRLEPRPRRTELDNPLQARVQDALWLLTRQWQFGEFHGEDTGSAIVATIARTVSDVVAVRVGDAPGTAYDASVPLETQIEQLPIDFPPAWRAQLGRYAARLIAERVGPDVSVPALRAALAQLYPLEPAAPATDPVAAARAAQAGPAGRVRAALAGRGIDGYRLATEQRAGQTLADVPGTLAAVIPADAAGKLLDALDELRTWFQALYAEPEPAADGWDGARLEYRYSAVVARDRTRGLALRGAPTPDGSVDWYSFDVAGTAPVPAGAPAPTTEVTSVIPGAVSYPGMPNARWWQMEDARVDLGSLRADSTDLTKIIVTDFAMVYGNDWFAVPYEQRLGTLAEIVGIVVTDVFGHRTLLTAATGAAGDNWAAWDLFSLSSAVPGLAPLGQHLFLPPTLPPQRPGPVLEEVAFVRDDAANMVWGIETRIRDGIGAGRDASEAARRLATALLPSASAAATSGDEAEGLRYLLGTTVPENWIPFVPVHTGQDDHSIRLQRAWMPRPAPAGSRVRPVTSILRSGIAADDTQTSPYFINEEEIPRAGVQVRAAMRRARWTDGSIVVWHARHTVSGRGPGDSGLRFDVLET
ncbi:hypothetical protein GA0074695_4246 [Micromonospora viridifaciens]|uniref:Uncharacterized protein n=1 Tax=Micromonospora viridifaciens TaxID=1881 RepID=A0A1C4YG57_MICVI|nr:hypothetical protein [Micromonospora viridifaciens]SCF19715.1 hypothetical protein GA0074695_4246 [Micromonospora viridifaciens]